MKIYTLKEDVSIWTGSPDDLKGCKSIDDFKRELAKKTEIIFKKGSRFYASQIYTDKLYLYPEKLNMEGLERNTIGNSLDCYLSGWHSSLHMMNVLLQNRRYKVLQDRHNKLTPEQAFFASRIQASIGFYEEGIKNNNKHLKGLRTIQQTLGDVLTKGKQVKMYYIKRWDSVNNEVTRLSKTKKKYIPIDSSFASEFATFTEAGGKAFIVNAIAKGDKKYNYQLEYCAM